MKKVLVLYYSQSGQLEKVIKEIGLPLEQGAEVECDYCAIKPLIPYPYPWPFYEFFNTFPEAVCLDGCAVEAFELDKDYDLIVLGYTVWFLSPSIPVTGFLQSKAARQIFRDKPVVTVIACRDMWLLAQEKMKSLLADLGARLVDNVVLTDQGRSLYTFVTTPRWLLTGKKDAFWCFPKAGISETAMAEASRFGERLCEALSKDEEIRGAPMLRNLGAVDVNGKLIASERIGHRSFLIWSRIIKIAGAPNSRGRNLVITIYALFLLFLVVTVVPLNLILRKFAYHFRRESIDEAVTYYEQPSGK